MMVSQAQINKVDAEQLLNNPIFQNVFTQIRDGIVDQLGSVPLGDKRELRDELVISLQVLNEIEDQIKDNIQTMMLDQS